MPELHLSRTGDTLAITLKEHSATVSFADVALHIDTWERIYKDAAAYGRALFDHAFRDEHLRVVLSSLPAKERLLVAVLLMGRFIPQLALLSGETHAQATPAVDPEERELGSKPTESLPAFHGSRRFSTRLAYWLVPISALLIGVVLTASAICTSGFSAAHPGTDRITYQLNADTGQAVWLSSDQHLDGWTRQSFPASTGQGPFQAPVPLVALAAPTARLLSDIMSGGVRTLRVQVTSPRHAEYASVQVEAQSEIAAATLDGKPFDLRAFSESARHKLQFNYYGLPARGFELTLSVRSAAPIKITVQDLTKGLPTIPGMTVLPRPADLMPASEGFGPSDPTIVVKSFTFAR